MNDLEILPRYTVKVNGGSGCLFQPSCEDYSYILTAKHVIQKNTNLSIIYPSSSEESKELITIGEPFLHTDEKKDAAIIKVERVIGIENLLRDESLQGKLTDYSLCGFPEGRKGKFRRDILKVSQIHDNGYIEAELNKTAVKKEIAGQSGGGILRNDNDCLLLAGIQKGMSASDDVETLGRVDFMPLSFFDEIIELNHMELTPLYPFYIKSLKNLANEIFQLESMVVKKELVQNSLRSIAKSLCDDFSPLKMIELYEDDLLISGTDKSMKYHKNLWLSLLELFAINQLHNESKLTLKQIKSIHKKRKLFFADAKDWTGKLEDIYRSNLSEVEKGGTIVVATTNSERPGRVEISSKILADIGSVPLEEMSISSTITNPFEDLRVIHIYKFQNHIIENDEKFNKTNPTNVMEDLKKETDGII